MELSHAPWIGLAARTLEVAGVSAILLGALIAAGLYGRDLLLRASRRKAYDSLRANLGRAILLGLELLVGADIIATITSPLTIESVGLLAAIVTIRTFVSISLEMEINGRWPWRRAAQGDEAPR